MNYHYESSDEQQLFELTCELAKLKLQQRENINWLHRLDACNDTWGAGHACGDMQRNAEDYDRIRDRAEFYIDRVGKRKAGEIALHVGIMYSLIC